MGATVSASERLRAWRRARDLSQREAATQAGLSQFTWCALERGEFVRLSVDVLDRVERVTEGAIKIVDWLPVRRRTKARAARA